MSRPKAFDPTAVLARAMNMFWSQGYEATSVQDLTDHLGIGRASLYATFGDKHSLYRQALEHYRANEAAGLAQLLASANPVLPAIRRVLEDVVADAVDAQPSRGCLAVNAAAEVAPHDAEVCRVVDRTFGDIETALHGALLRAQANGELPTDRDARALASFVSCTINGLRVTGKARPDHDRLSDVVAMTMDALR